MAVSPSLRVVELVLVVGVGAAVRRGRVSVDGCGDAAAAELMVVVQRQAQEAGAGGQVDVLHVLHVRPTHGTQLRERRENRGPSDLLNSRVKLKSRNWHNMEPQPSLVQLHL